MQNETESWKMFINKFLSRQFVTRTVSRRASCLKMYNILNMWSKRIFDKNVMKRIIELRCYLLKRKDSKFWSDSVPKKTFTCTDNVPNKKQKGGGDCVILSFERSESLSTCENALHVIVVPLCLSLFKYWNTEPPTPVIYYLFI